MPAPSPAPRLPLEPGDRQLYRLEPRIGCSPVSIVSVLTLLAFVFFFFRVAPNVVQAVQNFSLPKVFGVAQVVEVVPTVTATPEESLGIGITPLPALELTPTPPAEQTPEPSPTPFPTTGPAILDPPTATAVPPTPAPPTPTVTTPPVQYVVVANTEGTGVYLRAEPKRDAQHLRALPDNTILLIVGPNVQSENMTWRQVQTTTGDTQVGFILALYLQPTNAP